MSTHFSELCILLVDECYGALSSRVFSVLLANGRCSLSHLVRQAELPPRSVRHGLAALVQTSLAFFHAPDDEETFFEVNLHNAYSLVRHGKLAHIFGERFGADAARFVSSLAALGSSDISSAFSASSCDSTSAMPHVRPALGGKPHTNGTAAKRKHDDLETQNASIAIKRLCKARYIVKRRELDSRSPADLRDHFEQSCMDDFPGGLKGNQKKEDYRRLVSQRKRKWEDDNEIKLHPTSTRVRNSGTTKAGKRRKLDGAQEHVDAADEAQLNGAVETEEGEPLDVRLSIASDDCARINYTKCNVSLRTERLVEWSGRCIGLATSKVYAALLKRIEDKLLRCYDDAVDEDENEPDDDQLTSRHAIKTVEIEPDLSDALELDRGIGSDDRSGKIAREKSAKIRIETERSAERSSEKTTRGEANDEDDFEVDASRHKTTHTIEQHLQLLAEHPQRFVVRAGRGRWRVEFDALGRALMQEELESIATARFGLVAARIVRILHAQGKLDEKQVATAGLIRQKELRATLTAMQEAGFVETQEVPRDATRQPSRIIYLWFFDQARARRLVLDDVYKMMARLLRRRAVERAAVAAVLAKADRSDVRGHEAEYLSKAERDALAEWRDKEDKLLVQLSRQDDLVALLRDFVP